uniref:SHSP domain-containing protein n=1 Tax=Cacopsylla melanoneura TaxID=428564 RepID=A0A8D9E264_9HEMI
MVVIECENVKKCLEQSYLAMKNYPGIFSVCRPSGMEKRIAVFETSPNINGAVEFVTQEQNLIQSSLPEQCVEHFKPFEFPPDDDLLNPFGTSYTSVHRCGVYDPCGTPYSQPVHRMIHIKQQDQTKVVRFDFVQTSLVFDLDGLTLVIETIPCSCNDVQIILNDTKINVLALQEETHAEESISSVNGSYACYILRHFNRTFHLPHEIDHEQASIKQENNGMRVYIPWK